MMTTRDTPFAAGTPCWVDLLSSDIEQSQAFYGALFGWTFDAAGADFGGYVTASSAGRAVSGMMARSADMQAPDGWSTYIATDDLAATVAAATAAGAKLMFDPMQVGDIGTMAYLFDPAGAVVGLWQSGTFFGFGKYNEPGSVTWDENLSKDFAASIDFYTTVFGWGIEKVGDTDEFRYYLGQVNGETVAAIMDATAVLPAQVPSNWAVYFSVDDVDETVAKVGQLGGSVVMPARDTPYGRMAGLTDTTGATFSLHSAKLANPA